MKTSPTRQRPKARRAGLSGRGILSLRKGRTKAALPIRRSGSFRVHSILVPIDFSAPSRKALNYAVGFAERFGAELTLLHVAEPVPMPDFAKAYPLVMESDKIMTGGKAQLELLMKQEAVNPRMVEKLLVRVGRPDSEITAAARSLKVDLIIMSTHGYSGLKHALLGSTTERVVRHACCPVLVVREREHEFLAS